MSSKHINDPETITEIHQLIAHCGGNPEGLPAQFVTELIQTSLKLLFERHDLGQIKLITRSIKEMRYAYRVFNEYPHVKRVGIFGSARTPETHPDYQTARQLAILLAKQGWMCMTGAAEGIMKAGHEGSQAEGAFGLSILLPFETSANEVIKDDPKLINFRYFFTRKLMFVSQSDAIAVFPGGFGTHDELHECLTLMQTGKSNIIPVVLVEGPGGTYWQEWQQYVTEHLLARKMISEDDRYFYFMAPDTESAARHIEQFYRRFHSYRYVRNQLVMRMKTPLTAEALAELNQGEARKLVASGQFEQRGALAEESDHLDLPRIVFEHTRRRFGLIRHLIDQINALD